MKNYIYISLCALLSVAFAACQDDLGVKEVKSGLPAKLSLNIKVPASQQVTNSRAIVEKESVVEDLVLVMIEENSGRVEFVDLTSLLKSSKVEANGKRTYTLTAKYESPTLSGKYNIYAIANRNNGYADFQLDESTAQSMTDKKMKELIARNNKGLLAVDATTCPMSGISSAEIQENQTAQLNINLERAVSHIEFEFVNGSHKNTSNKTINASFTPEYYTVYNLPTQSYWVANDDKSAPTSISYVNSTKQAVVGRSFEFMMLENVQKAKANPTEWTYNDREAWTGDKGSSVEGKTFTYAPENGTFIVVTGSYEDESYVGEVSYTIHLGDISKNDYSNFAVNRNEYHKYTVTINGVENIIVESQKDEFNNGAEGELTKKNGITFILDAHYETVLVEIPVDKVIKTETEENKNFVKFRTPIGTGEVALSDIKGEDINWIQFAKPLGSEGNYTFPSYTNYTTIKGLIDDIKNGEEETYYQLYNGSYWTVAFVDEYFYDKLNPVQFVNAENRYFIFNPTPIYTSTDGNSIYHSDSGFQIWQRSIKTTYNVNSGMKMFGIETWDETGALQFGLNRNYNNQLANQSDIDGLANTSTLVTTLNGNGKGLSSTILSKVGYLSGVEDNTRESHVWGTFNINNRTVTNTPVSNAIEACLARNRDLDGSGTIDLNNKNGENELKWYIPAIHQYFIIWLGEELLPGDTRLFPQTDFELYAYTTMKDKYPRLFTSSSNAKRTYWPDQGACWAVTYEYTGSGADQWMGNLQSLRCCRNLFDDSSTPSVPAVMVDNVILVSGIEYLRSNLVSGYLPQHTERSADNFLPAKFEVLSKDNDKNLNIVQTDGSKLNDVMIEEAEAASSNQNNNDIKWRIPNQREMMLMIMMGVLPANNTTNTRDYYLCSTWFSQEGKTGNEGKHVPFMYDIGGKGENNAVLFLPTQNGASGVVRLVRDYTGEVEGLTASDFDSSFEKGGTGAGVE